MANNSNDYLIPFGIDTAPFKKGVQEIDAGTDQLTTNVLDATKTMQKGFTDAAAASDTLGKTLTVDAEKAAQLRETAKTLGKELGAALSGKNAGTDFEKKIKTFSDMLAKFSANANKPIKFNIDASKLEQFEKALAEGADELQVLQGVLEATKVALSELDPNTDEWKALNAQIQIAEGFLEGLGQAAGGAEAKHKTLKGELRELKAAMAQMEEAGQGDTQEFINMAVRAGELEDQIGDVSARVRVLASDTKYIDAGVEALTALAGGFAVAQGAAALFGGENEEINKTIQKVTGAMAVLQGIQAIANALNKDSTLSVLLNTRARTGQVASVLAVAGAETAEAGAATSAAVATEGFTAALLTNPVTAIAVGLAALVAALIAFTGGASDAEKATRSLNDALEDQKLLLSLDEASLKRRTDLTVAQAKAQGKAESEITTIEGKALQERLALRRATFNEFIKQYNDQDKRRNLSAEDNKKLEDELITRQQQIADDENEIQIKKLDRDKQVKDETKEAEKKALDQAKKDAEERKKVLEQQIKFTGELEKARVEAITDAYAKERAQVTANANQQIAQLEAEKSLSVKAEQTKQAAIKQIRATLKKDITEIDTKEATDQAAIQLKASELTIQAREEGIVKEIETIRLGYEQKKVEIKEQFKNETALRDELLAQLNDAQIREQKKAQDKFTNEAIAKEEERAVLEVETATKFLPDLPGIEEKKQVEILKVKVKFAEQARQALLDQGNAENSTVVLQATKAVQDLKKQLNVAIEAEKKTGGVDWFDLLGLGELTEEQRSAVQDAAKQMLDSISQITDFIVGQYQRQIDKKKEVISQIDDSIDDLEQQLDKEKDLREAGLANNVEAIQAEIDEKKKAREEEVKQAEELQRKQIAMQKLQLVIDTAAQASNLITASAKIFNSLAAIPFVGVPLAIATIALMTGAFVTAKVKAFQMVNDQKQAFGGGGYIDGKPHTQGGRKYLSTDGSGVVELEGGEYVTNKRSTAKYADLLEAINSDDISEMNEDALRDMLEGLGIRLNTDAPMQVLQVVRERDDYRQGVLMAERANTDISQDVQVISTNVKYLADKERARVDRWQDENYFYEKEGNKTTRIKKTKA
jgi:hypothetical protein